MGFFPYKATIEEGDTVILYYNREFASAIKAQKGDTYTCKFGTYKHDDIIGSPYGLKLTSHTGRGFVYLLHPTPELWTMVVPHRTQIIYTADISFITAYLNIKPGSKVIESGTGSGSFSHSLARTIGESGHLYTFEYHKERAEKAKEEFLDHGLQDRITVQNRDVCKDGFGLENLVDAVFLDLPAPWEAVPSAKLTFKKSVLGRICTFSPCIEQVQRSCNALTENGFTEITTFECLTRGYETKALHMPTLDEALKTLNAKKAIRIAGLNGQSNEKKRGATDAEDSHEPAKVLSTINVSKPVLDLRGHTSYLTFAVLAPEYQFPEAKPSKP